MFFESVDIGGSLCLASYANQMVSLKDRSKIACRMYDIRDRFMSSSSIAYPSVAFVYACDRIH